MAYIKTSINSLKCISAFVGHQYNIYITSILRVNRASKNCSEIVDDINIIMTKGGILQTVT